MTDSGLFRLLGNGDAIVHEVFIGTLKANGLFLAFMSFFVRPWGISAILHIWLKM